MKRKCTPESPDLDPNPDQSAGENPSECEHCLQDPCITGHQHDFLGPGQPPSDLNSCIRKNIYRRYWKVMQNVGGWTDPRYLRRKVQIAGGEWAVYHRREVMPKCVLLQARELYPNPASIPYMDHLWE